MKIQKVIFLLDHAVEIVSRRFGVNPLTDHEVFILYSIHYLPTSCSQLAILRHAKRCGKVISAPSVSRYVQSLLDREFIEYVDGRLSIAPRGREYLSAIRRFLLNKRL